MRLHGHVHVATGTKKSRPVAYQRRGDLWQGGVAPPPRLWQPPALCLSGGQRAHMLQIFEPPSSVKATWPQQFLLSDLWLSRCAPRHHTATCWCAALNCCWLPGSFFCAMSSSSASPWILSLTSRTCAGPSGATASTRRRCCVTGVVRLFVQCVQGGQRSLQG